MKSSFGAAAMLIASAAAAHAQDMSGVFSLGYGENSFADSAVRLGETSLKGRFRAQSENGISFGLQMGAETKYSDTTSDTADGRNIGADLLFGQQNQLSYGVYLENNAITSGGATILSANAYGLTAGYAAGGFTVKGFLGSATLKDQPSIDITALGINASYQVSQTFTLGANVSQHGVNNSGALNTVYTFGLGAVYQPTQALGLYGGLTSMDLSSSGSASLTEMGFGGSYRVSGAGRSPILATLEILDTDFNSDPDSVSFNTVRLGVTFPFGKAAQNVSVPINSSADRVFQPVRNVLGLTGDILN